MEKKDGFLVIHEFMWKDLGLSGVTLLVFARAYGFCEHGSGDFYESKARTAEFFGVSERTVFRAMRELVGRGLLVEVGAYELGNGRKTKAYRICREAVPSRMAPHDRLAGGGHRQHDKPSCAQRVGHDSLSPSPMTCCHPIHKRDNKAFERIEDGGA